MSLDSLLKPVKWLDEQILKQYTKVGKKFNLDKGRRKYLASWSFILSSLVGVSAGHLTLYDQIDTFKKLS